MGLDGPLTHVFVAVDESGKATQKDYAFVAVHGHGKITRKGRALIRSHVMTGKNIRIGVRPVADDHDLSDGGEEISADQPRPRIPNKTLPSAKSMSLGTSSPTARDKTPLYPAPLSGLTLIGLSSNVDRQSQILVFNCTDLLPSRPATPIPANAR